jgi:asparagine synthase (glutamine-hydrolysing)
MCGFVGFVDKKKKDEKDKIIKKMADIIKHRGPDDDGYYTDNNVALGFRRLSIIDLDGGAQPIYNEKKDKVIVFNGEIYNYREIRDDLLKLGYKFSTKSDTEVILHGYEEYGEDVLSRLRGMFAFVIYDVKEKKVFGARDFFGIKPLYYGKFDNVFMFGSEIKSFLAHPDFKKELNKEALKPYLTFQYSCLNETFFKNVYKIDPGHYFIYKDNKLEIRKYYDIAYNNGRDELDKVVDTINDTMKSSIEYHKISDVEVGSFLSSGVDSSYIVSCADVDKSFTVGFKNEGFDECEPARELSKILKKKHREEMITPDMFFDILPTVQYHSDEPHANLSAVPLYFLSKMASEDVKVVLSGEGADELFGGYLDYYDAPVVRRYKKIPYFIRHGIALLAKPFPKAKGRNFLVRNGMPLYDHYIGQAFIMNNDEANDLLQDKYKSDLRYQDIVKSTLDEVKGKPEVIQKMYLDMKFWLPYDILLKADKMTMANSLELRVPFLDKEVFKMASTVPVKYLVTKDTTKYAFRKAANEKIPSEWAKRKKLGFLVPFREWIKQDKYYKKVKSVFNEEFVKEFFDTDKLMKLLDDHYNGVKNNGRKVYTIYSFLLWYKVYFMNGYEELVK